jgi:hypothetical protein
VLKQLLCSAPPPPPPNVEPFDENPASGTVRQRLEKHRESPSCAPCHRQMDDVGFALENFDAVGQYRAKDERNRDIDTSGLELFGQPISDAVSLAAAIESNPAFMRCFVEHLYAYSTGRTASTAEKVGLEALAQASDQHQNRLLPLLKTIIQSDAFRLRKASAP